MVLVLAGTFAQVHFGIHVLHSYGFMQKAFPWLVGFMLSQLALMAIAGIPLEYWRSFQTSTDSVLPTLEHEQYLSESRRS